jgi:hypothetical protein
MLCDDALNIGHIPKQEERPHHPTINDFIQTITVSKGSQLS